MSIKIDDYSVSVGLGYSVGNDCSGPYLKECLATGSVVKHYYKTLEGVYLRNMPCDVLEDLICQLQGEVKRRDDLAKEFYKGLNNE